jgi:hypothetical protein
MAMVVPWCMGPFDDGGDLGGGAAQKLLVDRHRLALHVPVEQHLAAVVAGVPLGEDVLVERAHVGGVACDRGGALAQMACWRAAKVAVVAGGHRAQAGVGALGVHAQQQPLREHLRIRVVAAGELQGQSLPDGAVSRPVEHLWTGPCPPGGSAQSSATALIYQPLVRLARRSL